MKNKGTVLNRLLIMLAGLIHYPAQAQPKPGARNVVLLSWVSKKVMQQIGVGVFLLPVIK
jgi:hypothetical protein